MVDLLKDFEEVKALAAEIGEYQMEWEAIAKACELLNFDENKYEFLEHQLRKYPNIADGIVVTPFVEDYTELFEPEVVYLVSKSTSTIDDLHYLASKGYSNVQFVMVDRAYVDYTEEETAIRMERV